MVGQERQRAALIWQPTFLYLTDGAGTVPESYELVDGWAGMAPLAVITRISSRKWELVHWEPTHHEGGFLYNQRVCTHFRSLKQAKAVGLAVARFNQSAKP